MNELTSITHWENEWKKQQIEKFIEERIDSQILKLIKPALKEKSKVIELGCVPCGKLIFLKNHFKVEPYGLDYSWYGLTNSPKNLNLICADIFHSPFKGSFDLVYSMGVIEHFENPNEIIKLHVDMVKPGGLVLITIPNFSKFSTLSTSHKIGRRFNEVKKIHNMKIMNLENFRKLFLNIGIKILFCDFYGPPMLYLPPNFFLGRIRAEINKKIDKVGTHSSIFSPFLVALGQK